MDVLSLALLHDAVLVERQMYCRRGTRDLPNAKQTLFCMSDRGSHRQNFIAQRALRFQAQEAEVSIDAYRVEYPEVCSIPTIILVAGSQNTFICARSG